MPSQLLRDAAREVREQYPLIASNLTPDACRDDAGPLDAANCAIAYASRRCSGDAARMTEMLDSFAEISFDFLRLQARFNQTGHYARSTADGLVEDFYSDGSEMHGYIEGLLLTYALWPNHARILDFFRQQVIDIGEPASTFREIGVGHGLMANLLVEHVADASYLGIDLSPHTIEYCKQALTADFEFAATDQPWTFLEADATEVVNTFEPGDWFICCEVLEHVDHPDELLATCRSLIKPDGRGFLTTVANLEASDHVFLFHDAAHIRSLIHDAGFAIDAELALPLPGAEDSSPLPLNYAAVVSIER